jgi:UDP-N-acetylmuramoylalanine--D-glutamate ligase
MEVNINQDEFLMDTESIALEGNIIWKNAMAATSVAKLMQIRKATIRESLSSFQGWNTVLRKYWRFKMYNISMIQKRLT